MPKSHRATSRYAREAVRLLGLLIRQHRLERKMTTEQLAERAGVSRGLVQRAERGELGCAVGAVFEMAAIVGVPLFTADKEQLLAAKSAAEKTLQLLPSSARASNAGPVSDDF